MATRESPQSVAEAPKGREPRSATGETQAGTQSR